MRVLVLFFPAILSMVLAAGAQVPPDTADAAVSDSGNRVLTAQQWLADLDELSNGLVKKHTGLYSLVRRQAYREAVDRLANKIPSLTPAEIVAGFIGIAALPDDENTLVWPFQPAIGFHVFPVQAYWFDDGFYITNADEEYGYVTGSRIARIGGKDIDDVLNAVAPVIGAENAYHKKSWFSIYGFCPEILHARGIIDRLDSAAFTLVNAKGETYEAGITGVPFSAYARRFFITPVQNKFTPVITNRRARNYWFTYIQGLRTVYVQLNEIRDQRGGESLDDFSARLLAFADTTTFDRFVIDLRRRGGGSGERAVQFANLIGGHEKINRHDRLYTIIGRATSGTMLKLASMLEYRTNTIFVGEPTGEGPNGVGDSGTFSLPNSKIEVYFTKQFSNTSIPEDERRFITPDIRVGYKHQDFLDGRDPAMAAIFRYLPRPRDVPPVDRAEAARVTGRYLFSPYQIVEIHYVDDGPGEAANAAGRLELRLTDFIENSYFHVRSGLYPSSPIKYSTDINEVELNAALIHGKPVQQLFVTWKGHDKAIPRAPDGYLLPVELILLDRIEAGITALLADQESRDYYRLTAGLFLELKGLQLLEKKRFDDAIRVFRAGTELYPEKSEAWSRLGDAFSARGNEKLAAEFYRKSLEIDPQNLNAAKKLADLE